MRKWWLLVIIIVVLLGSLITFLYFYRGILFPPQVTIESRIPGLSIKIANPKKLQNFLSSIGFFNKNGVLVGDYEYGTGTSRKTINSLAIHVEPIQTDICEYGRSVLSPEGDLVSCFSFDVNKNKQGILKYYLDAKQLQELGKETFTKYFTLWLFYDMQEITIGGGKNVKEQRIKNIHQITSSYEVYKDIFIFQ